MNIGDLVKVKTKFYGHCIGTIVESWGEGHIGERRAWIVHIPNHWVSGTIAVESDMEVISELG
jgi:hypothetical protein